MGVVTGCLPTKGMFTPFISYGGSNLMVTYFVGLVINVMRRRSSISNPGQGIKILSLPVGVLVVI